MFCPICHKRECTTTVERQFSGVFVYGRVCDNCKEIAKGLSKTDFYNVFLMRQEKRCRYCGTKLSQIEDSLMVGCKECYSEFYNELKPMIDRLQGVGDDKD